jgi:hypothetical protein
MKLWNCIFLAIVTCLSTAWAQEIPFHAQGLLEELLEVRIDGGVQRAVLSRREGRKEETKLLVLLPGHPSVVRPEMANGVMVKSPLQGNFLIRARRHLVTDQVVTLLVDCHTNMGDFCRPEYQASKDRFKHVKTVIDLAKARIPTIKKVYLVSTSAGSVSSAFLALHGQDEFSGVFHTAALGPLAPAPYTVLNNFNYSSIKIPQAFVHHTEDPCHYTKYEDIKSVAEKFRIPLISVSGGSDFLGQPCMAFSQHGFRNKEIVVMRHMLKMLDAVPWVSEQL